MVETWVEEAVAETVVETRMLVVLGAAVAVLLAVVQTVAVDMTVVAVVETSVGMSVVAGTSVGMFVVAGTSVVAGMSAGMSVVAKMSAGMGRVEVSEAIVVVELPLAVIVAARVAEKVGMKVAGIAGVSQMMWGCVR